MRVLTFFLMSLDGFLTWNCKKSAQEIPTMALDESYINQLYYQITFSIAHRITFLQFNFLKNSVTQKLKHTQ